MTEVKEFLYLIRRVKLAVDTFIYLESGLLLQQAPAAVSACPPSKGVERALWQISVMPEPQGGGFGEPTDVSLIRPYLAEGMFKDTA